MNNNSIAGGVIFTFSVAYIILGGMIPPSSFTSAVVGPRVFPITIGILLAVTSLCLLIKGLLEARRESSNQETEPSATSVLHEPEENPEQNPIRLLVIIALFFGYVLTFFSLGYVLSTMIFILSLSMYLDRAHWFRNLIYSIAFPVTVFLLFNELLSVYLPTGPFS